MEGVREEEIVEDGGGLISVFSMLFATIVFMFIWYCNRDAKDKKENNNNNNTTTTKTTTTASKGKSHNEPNGTALVEPKAATTTKKVVDTVDVSVKRPATTTTTTTTTTATTEVEPEEEIVVPDDVSEVQDFDEGFLDQLDQQQTTTTTTTTTKTYDIDVRTGDKSGAGTDANVFVILYGDICSTDKIVLKDSKTHKKMFERDQVDTFTIESTDVGTIQKITIGHDNKGGFAGWYLNDVVVSNSNEKLTFLADRWLDKKEHDKKLQVELVPTENKAVEVSTHDGYVDVDVVVEDQQQQQQQPVIEETEHLQHEIEEELISIETTTEVHNEDESFLATLDAPQQITEVTEESTRQVSCIAPSEVKSERELEVSKSAEFVVVDGEAHKVAESATTTYEVNVKTGDVSGAGTDANVFIIIYGDEKDTGRIPLHNATSSHKHKFERNQTDSFVEQATNVGRIKKIRLGHDNKGGFAGWYVDEVLVNIPSLSSRWTLPVSRWLDKKEGDKQVECDVYPTLVEETYVDIIYEEVKVEDVDAIKDSVGTTVTTDKDGNTQMVVEEITTTTSSQEVETRINVKTEGHSTINGTGGKPFPPSHHYTFDVIRYKTPYNEKEWRLASVDDVLDSLDEAKFAMKGKDYCLCSLVDGYIGGKGFKYEVSGDVKKQDHKLLVKVPVDDNTTATTITTTTTEDDVITCEDVPVVESSNEEEMLRQLDIVETTAMDHNNNNNSNLMVDDEVVSCEMVEEVESLPPGLLDEDTKVDDALLHKNADILVQSVIENVTSTISTTTTPTTTTYDIDVRTGDKSGAGTDANVFVILHGDKCSTDKIVLKDSKTHKKMFERDQVDSFTIECLDVGRIEKITIGHDNKGGFAGWYLNDVVISNSNEKLTFLADRWLDKKEADKKLQVELFPTDRQAEEEEVCSVETTTEVHNEDEAFLATLDAPTVDVHMKKVEAEKTKGSDSDDSDVDEDDAMKLFKKFDVDGDGRITIEEFMAKLKKEKKKKKKEKKERKREKKREKRESESSDSIPSSTEEASHA